MRGHRGSPAAPRRLKAPCTQKSTPRSREGLGVRFHWVGGKSVSHTTMKMLAMCDADYVIDMSHTVNGSALSLCQRTILYCSKACTALSPVRVLGVGLSRKLSVNAIPSTHDACIFNPIRLQSTNLVRPIMSAQEPSSHSSATVPFEPRCGLGRCSRLIWQSLKFGDGTSGISQRLQIDGASRASGIGEDS